jgi:hypothetical protein
LFLFLLSVTVNTRDLHLRMDMFNNSIYSNHIYMTTDDGGLISFNPQDSSWNRVSSVSGLSSNRTKDLFVKGDSVFVLSEGGITIFNEDLTLINFQDLNPIYFGYTDHYCISLNRDKVILGVEEGIQWFDLNRFGNLSRVEKMDYNFQVFEISSLDTCYLLGTSRGVFRADSNFEDTTMIDSSGETYSVFISGYSIWAGGSWGCKEITGDSAVFSDDTVWTIGEIDGDIYIGTKRGLYRYEGGWQRIHGGDVRGFARVLPHNLRISVVRRYGLLFEGTWNYIYPPGLASNIVADLVRTPNGEIYVCHRSSLISVFEGDEWKVLNRGNPWGFPPWYLFNIESDSEGRVYFGFWYDQPVNILFCWDTQNDTMPRPIDIPIASATTVTGMLVDSNDDLWIGLMRCTDNYSWVLKMHRVNEDSLEWTTYRDPGFVWKRVFAEGAGGVYCGNSPSIGGVGIHILGNDEDDIETVMGILGSSTISMCADLNGNIWAGLEDKLIYISGNNVEKVEVSEKFDGLAVDFQGGLWCYNSTEGLNYLNPEGYWESLPQALRELQPFTLEDIVSLLHFTENQNLFVCTYNGLYEFDLDFNVPDSGKFNVYPNPFNYERHNRLNFSARDLGGKNILIYDVIGDLKGEYVVPPEKEVFFLDLPNDIDLSSGLYLYFVTSEERVIHKGKFVVVR